MLSDQGQRSVKGGPTLTAKDDIAHAHIRIRNQEWLVAAICGELMALQMRYVL